MNWTGEVVMETVEVHSRLGLQVIPPIYIISVPCQTACNTSAIQENMTHIQWDEPQRALLSLASIVGNSMGGSSGAVS